MLRRFCATFLMMTLPALATADVGRDIKSLQLGAYERAGLKVSTHLRHQFQQISSKFDETLFLENLEQSYQDKIRPGALEKISSDRQHRDSALFIEEIHKVLELRRRNAEAFRTKPVVRKRIQNVFIGALHVLDVKLRTELDSSIDDLQRVRRFLLSQGTFITRGGRLTTDDLWWDWLWVRGHGYPSDLVELHLQKVKLLARQTGPAWTERLKKHSVSTALSALRRNSQPALAREKPALVSLRLTNAALEMVGTSTPAPVVKELKLHLYRGLQASGQSYEAGQLKKEIAMDLFLAKGWQILTAPAVPWTRSDLGVPSKIFESVGLFVRGILTFLTYGAGLIFVATPIEFILVALALFILSKQGERHFNVEIRGLKALWIEYRLAEKDAWKRLPGFLGASRSLFFQEIVLAWRMFVASYTTAQVPFYSKIAASLLLFGVGLYFNSARTLMESVVAQMAM